jgi:hypothetical protein
MLWTNQGTPPDHAPSTGFGDISTQERLNSLRGRPHILNTGSSAQSPRAVPKPTRQAGTPAPFNASKNNHLTQKGF